MYSCVEIQKKNKMTSRCFIISVLVLLLVCSAFAEEEASQTKEERPYKQVNQRSTNVICGFPYCCRYYGCQKEGGESAADPAAEQGGKQINQGSGYLCRPPNCCIRCGIANESGGGKCKFGCCGGYGGPLSKEGGRGGGCKCCGSAQEAKTFMENQAKQETKN